MPNRGVFDRARPLPPDIGASVPNVVVWPVEPPPALFTDREDLVAVVRDLAETDRRGPAILAIKGLSGVGKTAALRWCAAELRELFDIALTFDFGPPSYQGAVPMADVLARLLEDLYVDERWIPADLAGRRRRYLDMTEGCRLLLLLDGVSDAAQVLTLLPNSSRALVIVAGEVAVEELALEGAVPHSLNGLKAEYGAKLLARLCADRQMKAEPGQVERLIELVGGSPKAIQVLAGSLRSRSGLSVAQLLAELERELTSGVSATQQSKVSRELTELFDSIYNWLPPEAARLYRLLGDLPGRRWTKRVIAAAYGEPGEIPMLIETLQRASLLDGSEDDGYAMLDLVRLHAQRVGTVGVPRPDLDVSAARAMTAWLDDAVAADFAVLRERFRVGAPHVSADAATFSSPEAAMAWFARWHDDLLAVARRSAAQGLNDLVWRLFQAMWPFYSSHALLQAWREFGDLAVAAAREADDPAAEARALCQRARGCIEAGDFPTAGADIDRAKKLSRAGGGALFASVLDFSGQYHYRLGSFDAALVEFEASLVINEQLRDQRGIALQSQFCGRCLGKLGRGAEALTALDRAQRLIEPFNDARAASRIAFSRAEVLEALGEDEKAVASLDDAINFARGLGKTMLFLRPLEMLAAIARRVEDPRSELRYVEKVVVLHRQSGSPRLEQWQSRLAYLSDAISD